MGFKFDLCVFVFVCLFVCEKIFVLETFVTLYFINYTINSLVLIVAIIFHIFDFFFVLNFITMISTSYLNSSIVCYKT